MRLKLSRFFNQQRLARSAQEIELLRHEQLLHMANAAKQGIVPAFIAPLICIPLFAATAGSERFYTWFLVTNICLCLRTYLILSVSQLDQVTNNIQKITWAIGLSSFCWGLGWLMLLPSASYENYLLYRVITLIFIFINMSGFCVHWKSFFALIFPVQIFECMYYLLPHAEASWAIIGGSALFLIYSLKMAAVFSTSWQRSIALRFQNEKLLNELRTEKDASNNANIAKSEFIATASHDLRQPMQAINIFLALFDEKKVDHDARQLIDKLKVSTNHLNKMFRTLLDISKLDAQDVVAETRVLELSALVSDLQDIFQPAAIEKNLNLSFRYEPLSAAGDKTLLTQILSNLISNALQYTQQGKVEVEFSQHFERLVVKVRDTGSGIAAQDLALIYKEFYRSDSTRSMHDGLGLGLAIVQRIAKLINASLEVESELGIGTTFTLETSFSTFVKTIPARDTTTQITVDRDEPAVVCAHPESEAKAEARSHSQAKALLSFSEKIKALNAIHLAIIDDDQILLGAYYDFFRAAGLNVHAIPLDEKALDASLMNIQQLDFILSDYRLGQKSGIDYIQRIREEFNHEIPATIMTADTSPENIIVFSKLGINVLYKPIAPEELLTHVVHHFFDEQPIQH